MHQNMSPACERNRWSTNLVKQSGLWSGLRLLLQILKTPHSSSRVSEFNVPSYSVKVHPREKMAHHATFKQCILTNQYDFLQAARRKEACQASMSLALGP